MPITEHPNHLCNVLVETGAEPLEYHCAEQAEVATQLIAAAITAQKPLVSFVDKNNHVIFVRARKVIAVETVYSDGR